MISKASALGREISFAISGSSKGISKIFRILSNWRLAHGLTLELNAFSPSDSDHWFKSYHFVSSPRDGQGNDREWHDERHGWSDGRQVRNPPASAILRLFERVLLHFPKELPTGQRRHMLRHTSTAPSLVSPPILLSFLGEALLFGGADLRAMEGMG
jgi:hypothetical protein